MHTSSTAPLPWGTRNESFFQDPSRPGVRKGDRQAGCRLLQLAVMILFFSVSSLLFAQQGSNAGLTGQVLDRSGAAVGEARIEATNSETRVVYSATTTSAGLYSVPSLPPGTYDIAALHNGFSESIVKNVIFHVGQLQTVNLTLDIASTSQVVEVTNSAELLETGSPQINVIISKEEMEDWPLLATGGERDISQYLYNNLPGATGVSFTGSINGGQTRSNEIYFEGVPLGTMDTAEEGASVDAVREMSVQTGVIHSQYNGGGTAVTNVSIKSGTNNLHGSLTGIFQNEAFNANGYAAKQAGQVRAQNRFNLFSVALGGPISIPKVYNGKDKSFFFFNYERDSFNNLGFGGSNATIPTPEMLDGDFSAWLDPSKTLNANSGKTITTDILGRPVVFGQIYNPDTTRTLSKGEVDSATGRIAKSNGFVRDPYANNKIATTQFNPVATNILKQKLPTNFLSNQVVNNIPTLASTVPTIMQHFIAAKLDQVLTSNQKLSLFYDYNDRKSINGCGPCWSLPSENNILDTGYNQVFKNHIARINHYWTITPSISNHLGAGWFRAPISFDPVQSNRKWAAELGIPNYGGYGFPTIDFSGASALGGGTQTLGIAGAYQGQLRGNSDFMLIDQIYVNHGAHQLQAGFEGRFYSTNWTNGTAPGTYGFSSALTDDGTATTSYAGNAVASFLLGQVNSLSSTIYAGNQHYRRRQAGLYVQDDWKAARNLTLNLGLRWEFVGKLYETNGQWSGVDLTVPNTAAGNLPGALVFASQLKQTSFEDPDWKLFLPRVGFAYTPALRVVFRGGFGMNTQAPVYSAEPFQGQTLPSSTGYSASIAVNSTTNPQPYADMAVARLSDPYPAPTTSLPNYDPTQLNLQSVTVNNPKGSKPVLYANYTFGVQVDMGKGVVAQINYIGNTGRRIRASQLTQMNQLPVSYLEKYGDALLDNISQHPEIPLPYSGFNGTVRQALAPYPQFAGGGVTLFDPGVGWSRYDALQATLTKRMSNGLSFFATYSWSKTLTNTNSGLQDVYDKKAAKGVASFIHVPQLFKITAVYELPFGRGRLVSLHGPLDWIAGGWKIVGNGIYQSGDTLSITDGLVTNGLFATSRPNLTGEPIKLDRSGFIDTVHNTGPLYLNPAAFSHVAYTSNHHVGLAKGNVPTILPNVQGPGYAFENIGIQKSFGWKERRSISIRMDAFNALNRAGRGNPVTDINNANFGRILSTQSSARQNFMPRILQLQAKVNF
ncbi:MAG: TonB-dependent receptor [Edaphobacter sp.]|uniref:TonB-dependent receptor n=1 Tax=Edaphobacter sp. TaxID=1934404 RepID=UPI00239237F9|nr:TonB-dependent receptor [Edaphobacter sp.]MDE1177427.1 TonB-dependent receptor [Edaphobacter sp.]